MKIKFSQEFAIVAGPSGKRFVKDLTVRGRFISIDCFLFSRFNPYSAKDKAALRIACANAGMDVSKPGRDGAAI